MMMLLFRLSIFILVLAVSAPHNFSKACQNASQLSTSKFRQFRPFVGIYTITTHYFDKPDVESNNEARGSTLEVKSDASNSEIELIFRHHLEKGTSEARWLISWDKNQKTYYVKRLLNSPKESSVDEGFYTVKFRGGELILERLDPDSDGKLTILFRLRWTMLSPNELRIVSEHKLAGERLFKGIVVNAKRAS